jgi:hypothetical protein
LALHIFGSCGIVSNPDPFQPIVGFHIWPIVGLLFVFWPCPFSPQLARRRRRRRKTKKKQKKEDEEEEEEERCSPNSRFQNLPP